MIMLVIVCCYIIPSNSIWTRGTKKLAKTYSYPNTAILPGTTTPDAKQRLG